MSPQVQHLAPQDLPHLLSSGACVVDIRDAQSYQHSHIRGSYHLNHDNFTDFMHQADLDAPLVVCCFHGISSIPAGNMLLEQGFEQVYSLDGGFAAMQQFPHLLHTHDHE